MIESSCLGHKSCALPIQIVIDQRLLHGDCETGSGFEPANQPFPQFNLTTSDWLQLQSMAVDQSALLENLLGFATPIFGRKIPVDQLSSHFT